MAEIFFALPAATQTKIDEAFNAFGNVKLPDEGHSSNSKREGMPLSAVHQALGFLELPQDDEDTFAVLEKAAKGWREDLSEKSALDQTTDGIISREDWRAVCAVLLDDSQDLVDSDTPLGQESLLKEPRYKTVDHEMEDVEDLEGGYIVEDTGEQNNDTPNGFIAEDNDSDLYQNSEGMYHDNAEAQDIDSDSPSDYSDHAGDLRTGPKGKKGQRVIGKPTSQQQQIALEAFTLFFPSTDSETALAQRHLTVGDLESVAKSLKENLKSDEVKQMIEWFSTSPDKTLSFDDFTRIMLMAGLV